VNIGGNPLCLDDVLRSIWDTGEWQRTSEELRLDAQQERVDRSIEGVDPLVKCGSHLAAGESPLSHGCGRWSTLEPPQQIPTLPQTFRTFVTGRQNALAYNAALHVVKRPGTMYNPLYLSGGSGLGKTLTVIASCRSRVHRRTLLLLDDNGAGRRTHERRLDCNDLRGH
jgi:hypothetical protein